MTTEETILYSKLPLEEQCIHKLWKVRLHGYEEAIKLFRQLNEKSPEWNIFSKIIKKFVIDSNAVAQEKGLEATLVFFEFSAITECVARDVMSELITICYGTPESKSKNIAIQITLMLIKIGVQDIVMEELVKGMDHTFPVIVSTCIKVATQAIKEFGSKVLNIELLLKKLQSILEDKDNSIRDEAKLLAFEIYSWIGPTSFKTNLVNLKYLQIEALQAEFEKLNCYKPQPTRFIRSQRKLVTIAEEVVFANGDVVLDGSTGKDDDGEKYINPVNILSQLNQDFYEKLEANTLQKRKEAIDMLESILSKAPKLESGEYEDLVRALKKIISNDSNVVIICIAVKCFSMLANGLKQQFQTYVSACLPVLLEKFKDKNLNVVLLLQEAVDAIYLTVTLDLIQEDILTAMNSKYPSVRAESVLFLSRCFAKCTPTILNKTHMNTFITALTKTLNESDLTVQDNSIQALGTAWKIVTEKNILLLLTSVDALKLAKVKEVAEKVAITAKLSTSLKEAESIPICISSNKEKKAIDTTTEICNTSLPRALIESEKKIDDDELKKILLTFCSSDIFNGLNDANWKTCLFEVQQFSQIIDQMELSPVSNQIIIKLINTKLGIKDNNVQKLKLECMKKMIEKFPITRHLSVDLHKKHNLPVEQSEKPEVVITEILAISSEETKILSSKIDVKPNKENGIPHAITATKKEKEVDSEPLFQQNNLKLQRNMEEHKLKFFKWNSTPPSKEFFERLRKQMFTAGVNEVLITNMFHSDVKYHLKAIAALHKDLVTAKDNNLALINNLDLVLKWMTIRFFDTNPSLLLKCLGYLEKMFDVLLVQNYNLLDTEASSFVPYLITKLGYPNESVRNFTQAILKQIAFVFPISNIYHYIIIGLKSKNSRQRSECLKHLTIMVKDYGTSILQPNVPTACKEIAKCIGDRDNSVRTSALNCFVAVYFLHGDAVFKFVANIPEKDMGLLRERLRKAVKNPVMPVATVQPTITKAVIPIQLISDADDVDDQFNSDGAQSSVVSYKSVHEPNPQSYSIGLSSSTDAYTTGSIPGSTEHSQALDTAFCEVVNTSYKPRFSLNESFIQELDAQVISKPKLLLKPYNWTDDEEVNLDNTLQEQSCSLYVNSSSSKPCLNVRPYSSKTFNIRPKSPPLPVDHIQQLLTQLTSENTVTSNIALKSLDKMLLNPDIRSEFLEGGKVLPLFSAIIERFDILFGCYAIGDIEGYKKITYFTFHLFRYQEFMVKLSEQIVRDLLSKFLYLLSKWKPVDTFDDQKIRKCINNLIMSILEKSAHTPVICALLGMFYDMANCPQNFNAEYKDLLMKCLWKIIRDFDKWGDDLCYDLVLSNVHKFMKKFGSKHWKNQPSDVPLKTCKTLIQTLVKLRSDKVLNILASPEFPVDSEMVVFIHKLLKHMNK